MLFAGTCTDLEIIILGDVSQIGICHVSLTCGIKKNTKYKTSRVKYIEDKLMLTKGESRERDK